MGWWHGEVHPGWYEIKWLPLLFSCSSWMMIFLTRWILENHGEILFESRKKILRWTVDLVSYESWASKFGPNTYLRKWRDMIRDSWISEPMYCSLQGTAGACWKANVRGWGGCSCGCINKTTKRPNETMSQLPDTEGFSINVSKFILSR